MTTEPSAPPSARPYLIGLGLALVLTVIPFGAVAFEMLPPATTYAVIAIAALLQVTVHLRFFLHIGMQKTAYETLVLLAFATLLIVIMVGGSLWIMFDLHDRMMLMGS